MKIYLTSSYAPLFSHNYPRLFTEIHRLLTKWNTLPISLFGRILAVKMTILPKLMYIFETLPISIHRGELKPMQVTILHFIWAQKRHKISNIVLLASKSEGALAVQDILKYY